ncbi:hypothetical protein V6N13_053605 [Hibiscus sabdariffa]
MLDVANVVGSGFVAIFCEAVIIGYGSQTSKKRSKSKVRTSLRPCQELAIRYGLSRAKSWGNRVRNDLSFLFEGIQGSSQNKARRDSPSLFLMDRALRERRRSRMAEGDLQEARAYKKKRVRKREAFASFKRRAPRKTDKLLLASQLRKACLYKRVEPSLCLFYRLCILPNFELMDGDLFQTLASLHSGMQTHHGTIGKVGYTTSLLQDQGVAFMNIGHGSSSVPKWICLTSSSVGGALHNRGLLSF